MAALSSPPAQPCSQQQQRQDFSIVFTLIHSVIHQVDKYLFFFNQCIVQ
jgi:hypothetical protein